MDQQTRRGIQSGIAAFGIWGLLTLYWKQLEGFNAVELIGWRLVMMTVVMVAVVAVSSVFSRTPTGDNGSATAPWRLVTEIISQPRVLAIVAVSSVLLTINWTTYVYAVLSDQVVETALGYFLAPLGTLAIGIVVLGETLTPLRRIAAGLAVAAVVILTWSYGQIPWLALIIAGTFSLYGLVKRRSPLSPVTGLTAEGLILLIPAIAIIIWGFARPSATIGEASATQWAFLLGIGIATAVPLLLFTRAARSVPFTILGPLNYLVPIINFSLGWLVFSEPMPASRLVGFVLVWTALIAVTVDTVRPRPTPAGLTVVR
jgi:chloramphenicol-sensitive protein RarD